MVEEAVPEVSLTNEELERVRLQLKAREPVREQWQHWGRNTGRVLAALEEADDLGLTTSEIARALNMQAPAVSQKLKLLEKRRLIRFDKGPANRKIWRVLTEPRQKSLELPEEIKPQIVESRKVYPPASYPGRGYYVTPEGKKVDLPSLNSWEEIVAKVKQYTKS